MKRIGAVLTVLLCLFCISAVQVWAKQSITMFWAEYEGDTAEYTGQLEKAFEARYPEIDVTISRSSWYTLHERLIASISAKQEPDLSVIGTRWLLELDSLGVLEPISGHVSPSLLDNIDPAALEIRLQNVLYGLPMAMGSRIMFYRSDLISSPPDTFDQLLKIAGEIHDPPRLYGLGMVGKKYNENLDFGYYLFANGDYYFERTEDGGYGKCRINESRGVKALQFMKDLIHKYKVTQPTVTVDARDQVQDLFVAGKLGFFFGGGQTAAILRRENVPFKWAVARIPSFGGHPKSSLLVTDSVVMFKRSQNKAAAAKFLEFFYQDDWRFPFDKATGFTPVTKSLAGHPYFQDPVYQAMIESSQGAKGWPLIKEWRQCHEIIADAVEAALSGFVSPQKALDEAAGKINALRLVR